MAMIGCRVFHGVGERECSRFETLIERDARTMRSRSPRRPSQPRGTGAYMAPWLAVARRRVCWPRSMVAMRCTTREPPASVFQRAANDAINKRLSEVGWLVG